MNPEKVMSVINGLPFVDDSFKPNKLLTLVAMLRSNIDEAKLKNPVDYLSPKVAYDIYHKCSGQNNTDFINACALSIQEKKQIRDAIDFIITQHPNWKTLFSIPIKYQKNLNWEVSFSNPLIPQQIYLGEQAFINGDTKLQEIIIHEMSHIWCAFLTEIYDFQTLDSDNNYVLPSGTGNKNVRGILLASLFAASTVIFYGNLFKIEQSDKYMSRMNYLYQYLNKSLDTIEYSKHVTKMGSLIIEQLRTFSADFGRKYNINTPTSII